MPRKPTSFFVLAGHSDGNMLVAGELIVGRIETVPACARDVDFRPGMGVAVLTFRHLNISARNRRLKIEGGAFFYTLALAALSPSGERGNVYVATIARTAVQFGCLTNS